MIQEIVEAKGECVLPLEKGDVEMVDRLGIQGLSSTSACVRRGKSVRQRVQREGS